MLRLTATLFCLLLCASAFAATVSGFVTRSDSAEPMQYVNVVVAGTGIGGQTNRKGYYVITLPKPGRYTLQFSQISSLTKSVEFEVNDLSPDAVVNVSLEKSSVELSKVVVSATAEATYEGPQIRTGTIHRGSEDIQSVVSPVEADIFRAVLTLPGVAPISDFSSGLYVRGGSPDQNLILLDDIDVYNPNHFGGIFSTFNTDAVESVELIKGGYPAKYGGRMSSVLDVLNRQGNRVHHQGVARWSLISSSATLEGPWKIGSQKGSYMGSIRRTYVELLKAFYDELPDYYFYDGHFKLNWDLGDKDKLSFSTYFGRDDLSFDYGPVLDLAWGNKTFTTQWVYLFSPRLFSQFVLAGSEFTNNFSQNTKEGETTVERKNGIHDLTAKALLSWKPNNRHLLDGGLELKWNNTWLKMGTSYQFQQNALPDVEVSSLTAAAFLQEVWEIDGYWTLQPGLRANLYHTLSVRPSQAPDAAYVNLEPRLSLRRRLREGESVYLNYGLYHQYLTLMSMEISTPMDVWIPLDGSLDPGLSAHYILGYKRELSRFFNFDLETYYKSYNNLLQYNVATEFSWSNDTGTLADVFHVGKGHTYGVDLMLRNDWRGLQGFIGYTLSQTRRKMEGTNINPATGQSEYFYPRYDRTHAISLVETFNVSQNSGFQVFGADLKLGVNFSYNTGQPTSLPERIYFDGEEFQIIYSYSDKERLPAYIRLDLSTKYEWITKWGSIEPYLEVINVFNRKNIGSRSYFLTLEEDGLLLKHNNSTQFPFLPFVGINVQW